jgi:hypothetical protein
MTAAAATALAALLNENCDGAAFFAPFEPADADADGDGVALPEPLALVVLAVALAAAWKAENDLSAVGFTAKTIPLEQCPV